MDNIISKNMFWLQRLTLYKEENCPYQHCPSNNYEDHKPSYCTAILTSNWKRPIYFVQDKLL